MSEFDAMALFWLAHQHPVIAILTIINLITVGFVALGWFADKCSTWLLGVK